MIMEKKMVMIHHGIDKDNDNGDSDDGDNDIGDGDDDADEGEISCWSPPPLSL